MKLLLFDIDGTLLRCGSQVRPIFKGAMKEVFGTFASLEGYAFAGKTDPQIVTDLVRENRLSDAELDAGMQRMRSVYSRRLAAGLQTEGMTLLPGVIELLTHLRDRSEITIGLLTGNWRPCADVKLACLGLAGFFRFGAFGDDGPHRPDLVPAAWARAHAATGHRFAPSDTVIIGDSELDVACAQAHGVPSLGVGTGFTAVDRLYEVGADWAFEDLVAAGSALPWLSGSRGRAG